MIKKTIEFEDFNGELQKQDFYFHLTRAELMRLEISGEGNSLSEHLKRVGEKRSGKDIMDAFDHLISQSYGERSIDGSRFEKTPENLLRFKSSEAYSVLFLEVTTDAEKSSEFWNGLVPAKVLASIQEEAARTAQAGNDGQTARERSEAQMQGYRKPANDPAKDVRTMGPGDTVTIQETAQPVLEVDNSRAALEERYPRENFPHFGDAEYEDYLKFKGLSQN